MTKASLKLTVILSLLLFGLTSGTVLAQEGMRGGTGGYGGAPNTNKNIDTSTSKNQTQKEAVPTGTTVRASLGKLLNEAIALAKNQDFQGALAKAKEADAAVTDKTPFEEFFVAQLLGAYSNELHDNAGAAAGFNRALASNGTPADQLPKILEAAFQFNLIAKNTAEAIKDAERLQQLGPLSDADYENLALAYVLSKDYANAIKTVHAAADQLKAKGAKLNERLLTILLNSQVATNDQPGARATLTQICNMPDATNPQCASLHKKK